MGQLGDQLDSLESKIEILTDPANEFTSRGVLTTLQGIDDKVSSLLLTSSRQHRARHSSSSSGNSFNPNQPHPGGGVGKQHHQMQAERGKTLFIF